MPLAFLFLHLWRSRTSTSPTSPSSLGGTLSVHTPPILYLLVCRLCFFPLEHVLSNLLLLSSSFFFFSYRRAGGRGHLLLRSRSASSSSAAHPPGQGALLSRLLRRLLRRFGRGLKGQANGWTDRRIDSPRGREGGQTMINEDALCKLYVGHKLERGEVASQPHTRATRTERETAKTTTNPHRLKQQRPQFCSSNIKHPDQNRQTKTPTERKRRVAATTWNIEKAIKTQHERRVFGRTHLRRRGRRGAGDGLHRAG